RERLRLQAWARSLPVLLPSAGERCGALPPSWLLPFSPPAWLLPIPDISSATHRRRSRPQRPPHCGAPNERAPPSHGWVGTRFGGAQEPQGFLRGPARPGPAQLCCVGRSDGGSREADAATGLDAATRLDGGPTPRSSGDGLLPAVSRQSYPTTSLLGTPFVLPRRVIRRAIQSRGSDVLAICPLPGKRTSKKSLFL